MAQNVATRVPPYGPFNVFKQILMDMAGSIVPTRLDSTYWGSGKSGSTQAALNTAFKFFGFVKDNKAAEPALGQFIEAYKKDGKSALANLIFDSYQDATSKIENLDAATLGELNDAFRTAYAIDGDVLRKAVRFFIHAVTDSGVTLSPYITKRARGLGGTRPRTKGPIRRRTRKPSQPDAQPIVGTSRRPSVAELLLEKFPDFDPDWSDETKQKWFESLRDLKQALQDEPQQNGER